MAKQLLLPDSSEANMRFLALKSPGNAKSNRNAGGKKDQRLNEGQKRRHILITSYAVLFLPSVLVSDSWIKSLFPPGSLLFQRAELRVGKQE